MMVQMHWLQVNRKTKLFLLFNLKQDSIVLATLMGHLNIIKHLHTLGVNLEHERKDKWTPIMIGWYTLYFKIYP